MKLKLTDPPNIKPYAITISILHVLVYVYLYLIYIGNDPYLVTTVLFTVGTSLLYGFSLFSLMIIIREFGVILIEKYKLRPDDNYKSAFIEVLCAFFITDIIIFNYPYKDYETYQIIIVATQVLVFLIPITMRILFKKN